MLQTASLDIRGQHMATRTNYVGEPVGHRATASTYLPAISPSADAEFTEHTPTGRIRVSLDSTEPSFLHIPIFTEVVAAQGSNYPKTGST